MTEVISCGGIVFFRGKILLLYKNQNGRYLGWVLPKGALEIGETTSQTALREVLEETGACAKIERYIGKTRYSFRAGGVLVSKTVHWYLMSASSYYCRPQSEEFFQDAGFYKYHEAYHLLKFSDERQILEKAFTQYKYYRKYKEGLTSEKLTEREPVYIGHKTSGEQNYQKK
ncbi:NUDIX hydrolase [Clostridia bacterium]|nr:NUDIX hydrolase [Clostridia bacterium]GHU74852.1 NUDIX hydrolase [Clostridia bacterium]